MDRDNRGNILAKSQSILQHFVPGNLAVGTVLGKSLIVDITPGGTIQVLDKFRAILNGVRHIATATGTTVANVTGLLTTAINAGVQRILATDNTTKVTIEGSIYEFDADTVDGGGADTQAIAVAVVQTADGITSGMTGSIKSVVLQAKTAPVGSAVIVEIANVSKNLKSVATLSDGAKFEETEVDMSVEVGDKLSIRVTQKGSGTAGADLNVMAFSEPSGA
jgi:hypothetical protein